jgi:hypothetical protein
MIAQGNVGQYIEGFDFGKSAVEIDYKILIQFHARQ